MDAIKAKLAEEAEAARREQEEHNLAFTYGKKAYGRGLYPRAEQLLTTALDMEGPFSALGGEIQLWLALAYQVLIIVYCSVSSWGSR